ncbi:MAG: hypothetical protein IKO76_06340 [Butyrivibrio sp.]|nr:hypothetical protein [Butyrivibrio sp.]
MLARRYQWMGIIALFLALLLFSDILMVRAAETGTIIGDGISETLEAYGLEEDEIWALINKTELRSSIDVEEIKETVVTEKLLKTIDKEAIDKRISDINLLESMDAETILKDYTEKKESGELDALIKDVLESEEFNEDYIKNHPVDIPNVSIPIVEETSPFDYIIDPQGLIRQTEAARYGGGDVKEDASVLFRNSEGEYKFSDYSDKLKITNKSTIPLQVTISAGIDDKGDIKMAESTSDLDGNKPSLFMALVDDEGVLGVLTADGNIEITVVLKAVPDGTYTVEYNEETEKYEYKISEDADETLYDTFSFGLFADCNTDARWSGVSRLPRVKVTWKTEPVLTDWDKVTADFDEDEKVRFAAYKKIKLDELREAELERLVNEELEQLIDEEIEPIIEEEVEKLAEEKFKEILYRIVNDGISIEELRAGEIDLYTSDTEAETGVYSEGNLIMEREEVSVNTTDSENLDSNENTEDSENTERNVDSENSKSIEENMDNENSRSIERNVDNENSKNNETNVNSENSGEASEEILIISSE